MSGHNETPLVTFVVPCYNSASYMSRAVDSLLAADHPCEILLVNDGSTDDTSRIAHEYEARYDSVRAIDQENANWGGAVNNGLSLARGRFFKVLDSDDYLEPLAFKRVLDTLAQLVEDDDAPDLLITNYIYDHLPRKTRRPMRYRSYMPQGHTFGWSEMGKPPIDVYIMIHACWYATETLRASGVELPTKIPYTDSLLLLTPMPYVQKLYYLDVEPYFYAIGREGQSVDVEVIKRRHDDQLFVTRRAIDGANYSELAAREPNCAEMVLGYIICMMSISTFNLFMIGTREALAKNDELWAYLAERDPELSRRVRRSWVGVANRRTALGRFVALRCYEIGQRIYKLA